MPDIRAQLHELMVATLADEAAHHDWTYRAVRPTVMPPRVWKPGLKVAGDCSKGCQFICWWTPGAPDPMRNGWSAYGNSQTIWLVNHHVAAAGELEVGDMVTFGRDGNEHAAMVMEAGADPLLWSFGHQGAPNSYRLSADRRERQFCKLPVVEPLPTPQDRLRAETGYYAWVAWRLGEGPWRHSGAANPKVRPNVPRVIPPLWWRRFAAFLLNRKKGS